MERKQKKDVVYISSIDTYISKEVAYKMERMFESSRRRSEAAKERERKKKKRR